MTRDTIERTNKTKEMDTEIWTSMRNKILRPRVQQILYKTMHKAYMVGEKWTGIPNFKHQARCQKCRRTESMEHILLECNHNAHKIIWEEAKNLWPHGQQDWPRLSLGTILGVGCIKVQTIRRPNRNNQQATQPGNKGKTRLLRILIAKASHLIWVLRCERSIQKKKHSIHEIKVRWKKVINNRLNIDKITATKIRREKEFTKLINKTWKKALIKVGIPHQNWMKHRRGF